MPLLLVARAKEDWQWPATISRRPRTNAPLVRMTPAGAAEVVQVGGEMERQLVELQ
jgi:hypothetical protein